MAARQSVNLVWECPLPLVLHRKIWMYAERLYTHCHSPKEFCELLATRGIVYDNPLYREFPATKTVYTFMSEPDYTFAAFMEGVPRYQYLPILERIVFDRCVRNTAHDNWNYYGESIKEWLPALDHLLGLAGITSDAVAETLSVHIQEPVTSPAVLLTDAFNDSFLDYIRGEVNATYAAGHYLSAMFLSRKLLETVFIRLLEVVFPKMVNGSYSPANHDLWYDKKRNAYRSFDKLLDVLGNQSAVFHEDRQLVRDLVALVRPFKDETNQCVHADYKQPDRDYVDQWRIGYVVSLARRLFRKYCTP